VAKVLLIDDEAGLRMVVHVNLSFAGIETLEAADGASGVELARTEEPDLILLDLRLGPGVDGWHVAQELRADPATASIPLILLTAHTDTSTGERGVEVGAIDFITKPFDVNDLVQRVVRALPQG
jgi:DNA-binding response OmpR family regulator